MSSPSVQDTTHRYSYHIAIPRIYTIVKERVTIAGCDWTLVLSDWRVAMKNKLYLTIIITLIAAVGFVETVGATPDGSQRLRGLGGRVFLVEVEVLASVLEELPVGMKFPNCYFFEADGTWVDPSFPNPVTPVPGTWIQHSNGAKTTYTASAEVGIVLWQEGMITPAHGKGVLQLEAYSSVLFGDFSVADLVSVGSEVDECPL
jgi:hypothetical protein